MLKVVIRVGCKFKILRDQGENLCSYSLLDMMQFPLEICCGKGRLLRMTVVQHVDYNQKHLTRAVRL